MPVLKHEVYCEVASCFTPLICQHTGTVEPLTRQEVVEEESQTTFRARLIASQRMARERVSSPVSSARRRLFRAPSALGLPCCTPRPRRKPGRRRSKKASKKGAKTAALASTA